MCDQQSLRSACAYPQSNQSLCKLHEYSMSVQLLTEHHFEFLSLKGGFTGSSESTHVKMPHCWKSYVTAQFVITLNDVWDRAGIELATPGSAVRHVTNFTAWPGISR